MNQEIDRGQFGLTEQAFNKRTLGRVKNAFDSCQLNLVGGVNDGIKAKSRYFNSVLLERGFGLEGQDAAYLNALQVLLMNSITSRGERYVEELGGEDGVNLAYIARDLVEPDFRVAIRVVMGATEEMPLRALSYLAPALQMMESFKERNVYVPQLQVVFANNISGVLNGQDQTKIADQTQRFALLARDYTSEFFGNVSDSVIFLMDKPLDKGSVIRGELIDLTKVLIEHLSDETADQLSKKGMRFSSRVNNFYAAAHVLVHDIDSEDILVPFFPDQNDAVNPQSIISLGGQQEKLFYKIRHEIKPHLDPKYRSVRTLQYFTRHYVPPYYMANGGDVSMDSFLQGLNGQREISRTAGYDLNYLYGISNARGNFDDFLTAKRG